MTAPFQDRRRPLLRGFRVGETLRHATPRTLRDGDASLYSALYGTRFAVQSADTFAQAIGYPQAPIDDLLAFHVVFGKTVPDVSLNAVANLGYAACRFLMPVFPGDTLSATSEVIGLRENSNRQSGIVYVRSQGFNQRGEVVIDYVRWVMVRKRDAASPAPAALVPDLPSAVAPAELGQACPAIDTAAYDDALAGSPYRWGDYSKGERIDHVDGVTVEEAEHQIATRLYQNTAKVHFNQFSEGQGRFGRRLIYGGHVISLARALSFNGLANAFHVAAINGGRHVAPLFAGDTVFAWSEILDSAALPGRDDVGALQRAHDRDQEPPLRRFPLARGRGLRAECRARSRLLGDPAALKETPCACPTTPRCSSSTSNRRSTIPNGGRATTRTPSARSRRCSPPGAPKALPILHIRHDSVEPDSPYRPERPGHAFKAEAQPLDGETVIAKSAHSAFVGTRLEEALDAFGATTLVVCGVLTHNSLEATARHAADLGYRVFVVADACWAVDVRRSRRPPVAGRRRPRAVARPSQRRICRGGGLREDARRGAAGEGARARQAGGAGLRRPTIYRPRQGFWQAFPNSRSESPNFSKDFFGGIGGYQGLAGGKRKFGNSQGAPKEQGVG